MHTENSEKIHIEIWLWTGGEMEVINLRGRRVLFVHFNVPALFPTSTGNVNSLTAATLVRFKAFTGLKRDLQSFARNPE